MLFFAGVKSLRRPNRGAEPAAEPFAAPAGPSRKAWVKGFSSFLRDGPKLGVFCKLGAVSKGL